MNEWQRVRPKERKKRVGVGMEESKASCCASEQEDEGFARKSCNRQAQSPRDDSSVK